MKVPYYPGCTLKSNAKAFEASAIASMRRLGIEMEELPRWNCCGTVFSLASDDLMHHLAPARILLRVQQQGSSDVVTLCSMCYNTLKMTNVRLKQNPEELKTLNTVMYKEEGTYDGKVSVHHLLSFLKEKVGFKGIKEHLQADLGGLKVAPYYGCLLLRPREASIDPNMENPTIMSEFIQAIGAVPVTFPHQTECCGAYLTVNAKDLVAERARGILESAKRAGAELVLTSCPLCQFNLEKRQAEIKKQTPDFVGLPVLYFTQLLAAAMGLDQETCGFDVDSVVLSEALVR